MASVEVLAGPERRRRWSVEQKQAIVAAAFGSGAVVRDVARQADVTPSLIYRWRRDLRAAANGFAQVLVAPGGDGVAVPRLRLKVFRCTRGHAQALSGSFEAAPSTDKEDRFRCTKTTTCPVGLNDKTSVLIEKFRQTNL
jgi:transposase-like protein